MDKMKRLTTDDPKDNFSMAMNYVYDKDHEAFIRHDGRTDTVPLYQYIDRLCEERGCEVEEPRGSEQTDWRCCDCTMDSEACPISMMYTFACQAVQLRGRLKMYEDAPELPEIVCLCGSTRFFKTFDEQNYRLTLEGKIVLSIGCNTKSDEGLNITDEQKAALDELHKRKIDLADSVFVLNVGGYIGKSTRGEIKYAEEHGKPITYIEPITS